MPNISFIYFDVGGVAILDFSGTTKFNDYFLGLGMDSDQLTVVRRLFTKHAEDICDGTLSIFALQDMISEESNFIFNTDLCLTKEFTDRFEENPGMVDLIRDLQKKGFRVGLLTNMYDKMLDMIRMRGILPGIDWNVVVDSSLVRMAKPSEQIYRLAQEMSETSAEEILFIDNVQENLDTANGLGWQTYLYDHRTGNDLTRGYAIDCA